MLCRQHPPKIPANPLLPSPPSGQDMSGRTLCLYAGLLALTSAKFTPHGPGQDKPRQFDFYVLATFWWVELLDLRNLPGSSRSSWPSVDTQEDSAAAVECLNILDTHWPRRFAQIQQPVLKPS